LGVSGWNDRRWFIKRKNYRNDESEQATLGFDTQISTDEIEYGDDSNNTENSEASHIDLPVTLEIVDEDMIENETEPIDNVKEEGISSILRPLNLEPPKISILI
jgi:hypothetical protein